MTTKADRKADPSVDRDRALAALILCAKKHPAQGLGETIHEALYLAGVRADTLLVTPNEDLAAAFHAYAEDQR